MRLQAEAQALQEAPGGQVAIIDSGDEAPSTELVKGKPEQGDDGLGGVPTAAVPGREDVADLHRLVLDALGLPDDARLRARLRPTAALTKSVCREWLQRGTFTRDEALDLLTASVLLFVQKELP